MIFIYASMNAVLENRNIKVEDHAKGKLARSEITHKLSHMDRCHRLHSLQLNHYLLFYNQVQTLTRQFDTFVTHCNIYLLRYSNTSKTKFMYKSHLIRSFE